MTNKDSWIVNVPVATVWTSYDSARPIDLDAIGKPVRIREWLEKQNYETLLSLCDDNLIQTQLLLGEEVEIVEEHGDWSQVTIPTQATWKDPSGYPGWIPTVQLNKINGWNISADAAFVKNNTAFLYKNKIEKDTEISFGTVLPLLKQEGEWLKVKTPDGEAFLHANDAAAGPVQKGNGEDIVKSGEKFLDLPYLWGGMSGFGYDCSGFAYAMCQANGYRIARDAGDQAAKGMEIALKDILPGDLLFFAYEEGKGSIHHVGIYYGDGKLLHSPKTGKCVEITPLKGMEYEKELCAARRYWEETGA